MDKIVSKDLCKTYYNKKEKKTALSNLNLNIKEGEIYCLLGLNGAGKTTFIKILGTALLPTSGDVFVDGISVIKDPEYIRKCIAVIPQDVQPDYMLTPFDYAYYFQLLRGRTRKEAKEYAEVALKIVDLWEYRNKLCGLLSGGEKRRAIISSALASNAEVMVLDEPTSGLDAISKRKILACLRNIAQSGKTILITTHNMEEAEIISDRIGIINNGMAIHEGSLEEIKNIIPYKYRVIVSKKFESEKNIGNILDKIDENDDSIVNIGDKSIKYFINENDAIEFLKNCLDNKYPANISNIVLEDIFIKIIGKVEEDNV